MPEFEDADSNPPRATLRDWTSRIALAAALVYLVLAIAGGIWLAPGEGSVAAIEAGATVVLVAGALTPVCALLLVALLAQRRGYDHAERLRLAATYHAGAQAAAAETAAQLARFEALLDGVTARLEALRGTVAGDVAGLDASAERLTQAAELLNFGSAEVARAAATLEATLPIAGQRALDVTGLLDTAGAAMAGRLVEIEAALTTARERAGEADRAGEAVVARLGAMIAEIDAGTARTAGELAGRAEQVTGTVDAALERTTAALDVTRDGVHAQSSALLASVDQARLALDHIGGETSRAIGRRLEALLAAADQLSGRLAEQDARSRTLVETIERSFTVLDAKLANGAQAGQATLDALGGRLTAVREQVHALGAPLGETGATLTALEEQVARLGVAGSEAHATLADALPATGAGLEAIGGRLAALGAEAAALAGPVAAGEAAIGAASAAFARERDRAGQAVAQLAADLETAHARVAEVGATTETGALTATRELIEVLGRVREVAAATAGTMRETLAGVVREAEEALAEAGRERAENAFGAPVRAALGEVEAAAGRAGDAAQAAVERVTGRLTALAGMVAAVEARIDEVDAAHDQRHREDIARRAEGLLETLKGGAVDVAKLLDADIGDTDWEAYLRGDRGVFARRAVRLLDGGSARTIRRNFEHDTAFREQVTRYVDAFESLMRRVLADRDGRALGVTLLGSDVGKLYVALAQAIERLR